MSDVLEEHHQRAFHWPEGRRRVFGAGVSGIDVPVGSIHKDYEFLTRLQYRKSYEEAVGVLFKHALTADRPDHVLLPLAFMWRQLIEIALKDLIRCTRDLFFEELSARERDVMKSHDLAKLWAVACVHMRLMGSEADPAWGHVDAVVRELHDIDPTSDGFRYPFKRDGTTPNLANAPEHADLVQMHETLAATFNFLDAGLSEIDRREDFFEDYEREMAKEFGWPDAEDLGRARRAYCEFDPSARVVDAELA